MRGFGREGGPLAFAADERFLSIRACLPALRTDSCLPLRHAQGQPAGTSSVGVGWDLGGVGARGAVCYMRDGCVRGAA